MRRRLELALVTVLALGCGRRERDAQPVDRHGTRRAALVEELAREGIRDARVLAAIGRVERHQLVREQDRADAYEDRALAIGHDQTISQPWVVATMTEAARIEPGARILEIGTGSGYQAAVLAELGADVYSIEIVEPLARRTAAALERMGYGAIHLRVGDGYRGWPEAAPFAAIVVTAAPPTVPEPLIEQLEIGGRLVIPVDAEHGVQELLVITRTEASTTTEVIGLVRFVPMTGEAQE